MYQLLDPGFIGLIFSCFNEDVNKVRQLCILCNYFLANYFVMAKTGFDEFSGWKNPGHCFSVL